MRVLHRESGDLDPFLCLFTHDNSWLFALTSVLCLSICNSRANLRMVLAEGFTGCIVTVEGSKGGGNTGKGFAGKERRSSKIMENRSFYAYCTMGQVEGLQTTHCQKLEEACSMVRITPCFYS